ncbi:MAG: hydrogenase-4 component E [Cyclobacteriaceae bacterium]|jgi:hydrogenase-4 component E
MVNFLIIIFIISLLYLAKIETFKKYVFILGLQGLLLFGVALFELKHFDIPHLILILTETLIFKGIFVPVFLNKLSSKRNNKSHKGILPPNASILIALLVIVISFTIGHNLHDEHIEIKYFTGGISAIAIGLYIAINNKDMLTHLTAYLIIENGIFLLSIALGSELPMFVNAAILLDIFSSVLIMGIFFNKVHDFFDDTNTDQLSTLKD